MESSGCVQDAPFPHPLETEPGAPGKAVDKRFWLQYVGGSRLDLRTTLPMLPWLVAEIRRRSLKPEAGGCGAPAAREVLLVLSAPFLRCIPARGAGTTGGVGAAASQPDSASFIFEHKVQHVSRFIHNSHDPTCFAYLIKAQPDDPESQMACHVFRAADSNQARARFQGAGRGCGDGAGRLGRRRAAQQERAAWAPHTRDSAHAVAPLHVALECLLVPALVGQRRSEP